MYIRGYNMRITKETETRDARDKTVTGKTNNIGLALLQQLCNTRMETKSAILHHALLAYGESQDDVPETLKRAIFIDRKASEIGLLGTLASKNDDFANIKSKFIDFCVEFGEKKSSFERKEKMNKDIRATLTEIELNYPDEFLKLERIGKKNLNKSDFELVFTKEPQLNEFKNH